MLRKLLFVAVLAGLVGILAPSCTVNYTFTGANLSPKVKTFTVYYFPNRARLINPTLSQSFTEELREKLTRQTSLNELSESGDLEFEGQITGYEFRPMSIQKEDESAQTRLTITINLKYTNNQVSEENFEKSFSAYEDFDSNLSISSVEEELSAEIIKKLTEDIFNATIANW
ncbi:LptE family protein [Draconibacterium sediminis]|uniref:Lipoprotein n=1 Tax=Draconibacterium sediminis TaxID=1544798 RepID=A0A0D8JFU3_9BACT|nr:LptE family protein [Draconibacterium sediminis]KJF44713.1 hypothetical protein LH29_04485 [Draconibacterium sediminis]